MRGLSLRQRKASGTRSTKKTESSRQAGIGTSGIGQIAKGIGVECYHLKLRIGWGSITSSKPKLHDCVGSHRAPEYFGLGVMNVGRSTRHGPKYNEASSTVDD